MRIRLRKKLAEESLDGIDVSRHEVGDVMDLPDEEARLLILEGWATPAGADVRPASPTFDARSHRSAAGNLGRRRSAARGGPEDATT